MSVNHLSQRHFDTLIAVSDTALLVVLTDLIFIQFLFAFFHAQHGLGCVGSGPQRSSNGSFCEYCWRRIFYRRDTHCNHQC